VIKILRLSFILRAEPSLDKFDCLVQYTSRIEMSTLTILLCCTVLLWSGLVGSKDKSNSDWSEDAQWTVLSTAVLHFEASACLSLSQIPRSRVLFIPSYFIDRSSAHSLGNSYAVVLEYELGKALQQLVGPGLA